MNKRSPHAQNLYLKSTNIMSDPDSQHPNPVEMVVSEGYVNELRQE